ncbi:unnamed protein product [Caenorhabditis bovis]|uniref:Uncharacterized protein n=1 Tax=Caenorhabditis bovis TaxID=2654633 RepID=A0A8S1F412_9PELO|nr:unnamed protein product [Caenorhabditis bovis]
MQTQELGSYRERPPSLNKKVVTAPCPATKETSSNGWDYWSRIYSETGGRNGAANLPIRDMRISYLLASESLVRAKLLFLNVPGLPTGYKNIILNLLKKELKEEIPIQDVIAQPGKWYLHFYRPADALRVLKHFNGFNYRSHTLLVKFCYPDGTYGDEAALTELVTCTSQSTRQIQAKCEVIQEPDPPGVWSPVELEAVRGFERELISILKIHKCVPYFSVISSLRNMFVNKKLSSYFISAALGQWSTGFIRIFHRNVKVVANSVCLATSDYYTQRIRDAAKEGTCGPNRDTWEPCLPYDIRSEVQLKQYAYAFLCHFGPQHIKIDIPIRLLALSLRGIWPKTGPDLAEALTKISANFVIINNVLYLSTIEKHHEHLIDNLAALQYDADETANGVTERDLKRSQLVSVLDL